MFRNLITILTLVFILPTTARTEAAVERDEDLYGAIVRLNERFDGFNKDILVLAAPQVGLFVAQGFGFYYLIKQLNEMRSLGVTADKTNLHKSFKFIVPTFAAQLAISAYMAHRHTPAERTWLDRYKMLVGNFEVRPLVDLSDLWRRSLAEQYDLALKHPDLHTYLLDLDAWMQTDQRSPRPIRPSSIL